MLPRPAPRPAQWRLSGGACPALSAAEWPTLIRNLGPARRDSPLGPDPLFGPIFSLHQKFPNLMGNRWRPPARESPQWRRGPAVLGSSWGTKKSWWGGGARRARGEISGTGPEGVPARRETIFAAILKGDQQLHMFRPHPPPSSGRPPPPRSLAFQGSTYRPLGPGTPPRRHSEGAAKRGRQRRGLDTSNSTV